MMMINTLYEYQYYMENRIKIFEFLTFILKILTIYNQYRRNTFNICVDIKILLIILTLLIHYNHSKKRKIE